MQATLQINLQKLETKQSVVNSLGMFLAIAEGYLISNGIKITPLFSYYDHFNITQQNRELIRVKLLNNYMSFSAQKENYLNEFGGSYDFYPDNYSVINIREKINEWIPLAAKIGERDLYTNILSLFSNDVNQKSHSYYNEIKEYKNYNKGNNKEIDPRNKAKAIAKFHEFKEEEHLKNLDNWEKNKKFEVNIVLGGKPESSSLSQKLKPITKKTPSQIQEEVNDINFMQK